MSMRVRTKFSKTEAMRFTGHLDLFRALERTVRRAKLPLTYSQGFNPHPKISLASALPLGFTSEAEFADIFLDETLPLTEIDQTLINALPSGIQINEINLVDPKEPKLQNSLRSSIFSAILGEPFPNMEKAVLNFLSAEEVIIEKIKKGKKRLINIREFVHTIEIIEDNDNKQELRLHLSAVEGKTGRPDVILEQIGINPLSTRFHRTDLIFKKYSLIESS